LEQQLARWTSIIYVKKQLSRFVSSGICCSFTRPLCAISLCTFYALHALHTLHALPMSSTGGTDLSGLHSISLYVQAWRDTFSGQVVPIRF